MRTTNYDRPPSLQSTVIQVRKNGLWHCASRQIDMPQCPLAVDDRGSLCGEIKLAVPTANEQKLSTSA